MAKYLLLKHYRGAPASANDVPMDQWTPEEISAHVQYMDDWAARLEGTGEFVEGHGGGSSTMPHKNNQVRSVLIRRSALAAGPLGACAGTWHAG